MKKLELRWKEDDEKIIGYYGSITFVTYDKVSKFLKTNFIYSFSGEYLISPGFKETMKKVLEEKFQKMIQKMDNFELKWKGKPENQILNCGNLGIAIITKNEHPKNPKKCWRVKCWLPQELNGDTYDTYIHLVSRDIVNRHIKNIEEKTRELIKIFS